jgi:hypothetical protein
MTIHNEVLVEVPLPDGRSGVLLETDAFEDLLDSFRIRADGRLIRRIHTLAESLSVRENADDFFGGTRAVFVEEEGMADFSGFMILFESRRNRQTLYYTARIDRGRLIGIRTGRVDAWAKVNAAGDKEDAFAALVAIKQMLSVPEPDVQAIRAFVDESIGDFGK